MRTLKSILLAGTMLLATPMFFSSCEEDGSLIKFKTEVQVVNDFNDVVKAINDGKLSSEQAIAQLVSAIDNIKGDQSAKLQAITDALNNKNNTLDTKLNVIAGTMKSLSTEMPTKIDALAKAVENMPEYYEVLKAVETALVNINPNEQLKLLEGVLDKYCSDELKYPDTNPLSFKGKMYYCIAEIEDTMRYMTYKDDKFKAIRKAIEALAGENAKLDGILDNMTKIVEAIKNGNTSEKEGWAEIAKQLELLKAAAGIGGSTDKVEYVDLGLPSGNLWAKCNLGASAPEAYGDYYAWGEVEPKQEYTNSNHKWYKEGAPSLGFTKYNNEDGKLSLENEDDAVIQKLGNGWRTPTLADFRELTNQKYTTIEKTTLNGVAGYQITSKKNKKSIFIPFAGFKNDKPQTREISSDEISATEKELDELLKLQGKYNNELKNLKKLKSKIMSNIVANMGDDGDEKRDKDKQLIDEINEKADNIEGELIEIQKNIKAVNDRLMLLSMDYFSEKIEKNKLESKEIDDWIANIRVELKKNVIRKQNRDINNREIYSYLHDIFGAEVLDLFDIEYDDPMVFNANNANTDNANNENKGN